MNSEDDIRNQLEALRGRTQEMDTLTKVHEYAIDKIDVNMSNMSTKIHGVIENQFKLSESINGIKTELNIMKTEDQKRKSSVEFVKELFDKKKNWMIVIMVIIIIKAFETINPATIFTALSKFL